MKKVKGQDEGMTIKELYEWAKKNGCTGSKIYYIDHDYNQACPVYESNLITGKSYWHETYNLKPSSVVI